MNKSELNSYQILQIENDVLLSQLKRLQSENQILKHGFNYLEGQVIGVKINTVSTLYPMYLKAQEIAKK